MHNYGVIDFSNQVSFHRSFQICVCKTEIKMTESWMGLWNKGGVDYKTLHCIARFEFTKNSII